MTVLKQVEEKAARRIGMTASTKSACALHGKPGKIISYQITETGDTNLPYAISSLLGFESGEEIISHEKDTVVFLGSGK